MFENRGLTVLLFDRVLQQAEKKAFVHLCLHTLSYNTKNDCNRSFSLVLYLLSNDAF